MLFTVPFASVTLTAIRFPVWHAGSSVFTDQGTFDRLYRNFRDWVTIDDVDVAIHFVKENKVVSKASRSSDKFMHAIQVAMAKNYVDNLSEEVKKGFERKPSRATSLVLRTSAMSTIDSRGASTWILSVDRLSGGSSSYTQRAGTR